MLDGDSPETLLLCEHQPVVTLGRSAKPAHVLLPAAELARRGVDVHTASRGGDVTYHGPGQLVGYPIVRLRGGVIGHVTAMARAIASVLAELGIDARWRRETPGLWVGGQTARPPEDLRVRRTRPPPRRDPRLRAQRRGAAGRLRSHRSLRSAHRADDLDRRVDVAADRPIPALRICSRRASRGRSGASSA